jgi:hypothetical protein
VFTKELQLITAICGLQRFQEASPEQA